MTSGCRLGGEGGAGLSSPPLGSCRGLLAYVFPSERDSLGTGWKYGPGVDTGRVSSSSSEYSWSRDGLKETSCRKNFVYLEFGLVYYTHGELDKIEARLS